MVRNWRDDGGASAVEYSLIAVAIAAIIATVVFVIGGYVKGDFQGACDNLDSVGASTTGGDCNG
jgi:Flp pilus assembly pilin Flp